ncbi:DUF4232 domain-containing protein [Streptomyces sp. NPDC048191]|uniref:DUF4232 domain-containing protein n=1 Tax=Streptomyces sp. NPDC048191 TaxID=3155484 RepID=UPI003406F831
MRMRHIRLLAATGTALAALALTACGDGTGTKDEGAAHPAPSAATTAPGQSSGDRATSGASAARTHTPTGRPTTRTGTGTGTRAGTGTGSGHGAGTGTGTAGSVVLCNGANTTVTARPVTRPLNHMLITVKNTGTRTCLLPYYPVLRFDEMQWAPQGDKATQPQAVTTLAPGESGYAGVLLSAADGSGEAGATGHRLTVMFQGRTPNSDGGPAATPALPAKGVYYDSSLKVTYWQQNADDALDW